jgi:hypothetical protein
VTDNLDPSERNEKQRIKPPPAMPNIEEEEI